MNKGIVGLHGLIALTIAMVVPFDIAVAQEQDAAEESCVTCHMVLDDERLANPAHSLSEDVHGAAGLGCSSCHGGDPTDAGLGSMVASTGFIGRPDREETPQFCGRCHSDAEYMRGYDPGMRVDQAAEYWISIHGRQLRSGDPNVATCISCHPAHSIKAPSDPRSSVHPLRVAETCGECHADVEFMEPYDIPTNQLEGFGNSIHWQKMSVEGDLSAPTCNDCHGNHGAAPPGISSVGNVCGQCHVVMADLFEASPHALILAGMGMPGCATCHSNHRVVATDDSMLGVGEGAVCAMCHTADAGGGMLAATMRTMIDSLVNAHGEADSILHRAERAGMEVSEAQVELSAARTALLTARAAVHSFTIDAIQAEVEQGLEISSAAHLSGVEALEDLRFRRLGLGVSVFLILLVAIGLVMKIREIERVA